MLFQIVTIFFSTFPSIRFEQSKYQYNNFSFMLRVRNTEPYAERYFNFDVFFSFYLMCGAISFHKNQTKTKEKETEFFH